MAFVADRTSSKSIAMVPRLMAGSRTCLARMLVVTMCQHPRMYELASGNWLSGPEHYIPTALQFAHGTRCAGQSRRELKFPMIRASPPQRKAETCGFRSRDPRLPLPLAQRTLVDNRYRGERKPRYRYRARGRSNGRPRLATV